MGLRKLGDETKVMKMKIVPTREKHEATRSVVSSELNCLLVKGGMVVYEKRQDSNGCCMTVVIDRRGIATHVAELSTGRCMTDIAQSILFSQ